MNEIIICVNSKDDSFVINREYQIEDGFIYTEQNVSINTKPYNNITEAIDDLKNKGYIFKSKIEKTSDAFGGNFTTNDIFGDIFSMCGDINLNTKTQDEKRKEAESLKNDILGNILKGF